VLWTVLALWALACAVWGLGADGGEGEEEEEEEGVWAWVSALVGGVDGGLLLLALGALVAGEGCWLAGV
jgi:hypothetical protein